MRKNDLAEYGPGIVLYFQILKYLAVVFLLMTILSLPAYFFYWCGNASSTADFTNIKYVLAALSLGNIGNCNLYFIIIFIIA
jgi:hypothetical protein